MTVLQTKRNTALVLGSVVLSSVLAIARPVPVVPPPSSLIPERIILTLTADPAHSEAVTWRTEKPENAAEAQIAPASANPNFQQNAVNVQASAAQAEVDGDKEVGEYSVEFSNLKPGTRYSYRVGDGTVWSGWNTFETASDKPEPFRFLYLGDEQNSIKSLWSRSVRAAYSKAPDARFIVHAGDLIEEGYDDNLWGEWCDAMGFIREVMPSFPVPGNHDLHRPLDGTDGKTVLSVSPLWNYHFKLPMNGPQGVDELKGQSYFVDYQGVRFISLDVNVYANEAFDPSSRQRIAERQTAWLEQVLKTNPNRWTIVVQHQPIYTVSKERDYEQMRAVLSPLYDKYHVDLVLQGHDHAYARSYPLVGNKLATKSQKGTVYVISVSGPKMYDATGKFTSLMAKEVHNTEMFQVIDVDGSQLKYRAYSIDGVQLDSFELHKPTT